MNKTTVYTPATGFSFPVGERGGDPFKTYRIASSFLDPLYYKSLGFWHPGEDWNGKGGGDTDLGDPVFAIAKGCVLAAAHFPVWGNIILIQHLMPDGWDGLDNACIWSQYAHLDQMYVKPGQMVDQDDLIGTIGKGDQDSFVAHLHFEIRRFELPPNHWDTKDKEVVRAQYFAPTDFIQGQPE